MTNSPILIKNEFAAVELEIHTTHGGTLLHIRDILRGTAITLDALELESLTRLHHADFGILVNPNLEGLGAHQSVF